jgi:hypothetical protein
MKKYKAWLLLAGLIILTHLKAHSQMVELQKVLLLKDFPSGSSIELYDNKFYLIGDDATKLLVLDKNYNKIDSIQLFKQNNYRISKTKKVDLEASTIITVKDQPHLLMLGSASTKKREKAFILSFGTPSKTEISDKRTSNFFDRIVKAGVKEINIEGAANAGKWFLLGNRGNNNNRVNQLISTTPDFLENQKRCPFKISTILLDKPKSNKGKAGFVGISGLAYVAAKDLLLFTASTEDTGNATDDGEIGNSYLGWINNISEKLADAEIKASMLINLNTLNKVFAGEKIESICVEKTDNNRLTLHLVSDNDNGQSKLFKLQLSL